MKKFISHLTPIIWLIFFALCLVEIYIDMNKPLEKIIKTIAMFFLLAGIISSIILLSITKKSSNKTHVPVDDNIKTGRKLYKKLVRSYLKKLALIDIVACICLLVPIIIYFIINFDLVMIIVFSITLLILPTFILSIIYVLHKNFYFCYREILFNNETFVLFSTKTSVGTRVYNPCFHVVYKCNEHTRYSREIWLGTGHIETILSDILIQTLGDIIDWFNDKTFSNFLRIDIETESGKTVQCVFKLNTHQFIVTDTLDLLEGCFETNRSKTIEKRKNNKSKK